jgi:transcriptional regulator with XRE-family HTH domain
MGTKGGNASGAAKRVRAARKQAGLTQVGLAKRLQCSQAFVSLAETGAALIGEDYVRRVLTACGLAPEWGAPPAASEESREGWDLLPEEIAGLDPETFVPVRKESERDLKLAERYRWWNDRREERLALESARAQAGLGPCPKW